MQNPNPSEIVGLIAPSDSLARNGDVPPDRASSVTTFTLVDSRLADESFYGPEGHLSAPYRIFSIETNANRHRELITSWCGPMSEQWMQIPETPPTDGPTTLGVKE